MTACCDYGMAPWPTHAPDYEKDASDVVDYSGSWHHLGTDTLITSTWESDGLTVDSSSIDGLTVTVTVSGGTAGAVYKLTNHVVTGMGRNLNRSLYIAVSDL